MKDPKFNDPPWHPIADPVQLKTLGKLSEELGELVQIISRCIIQGVDGVNPDNGVVNFEALWKEIADVKAGIALTTKLYNLPKADMNLRSARKYALQEQWHKDA